MSEQQQQNAETQTTDTTPAEMSVSDWYLTKALPPELQTDPKFKNFMADTKEEIFAKLAKSYDNASRMIGYDQNELIRMPRDPEKQADAWNEIFKMRGRPESYDKYEVAIEGIDPEVQSKYLEAFHKVGLGQSDVAELVNLDKSIREAQMAKFQEEADAQWKVKEAELQKEWGPAYEAKLKSAELVAEKYFPDINMSQPSVRAAVIDGFAKIADAVSEDSDIRSINAAGNRAMTPAEAKMAIAEFEAANMAILKNPNNPLRAAKLAERDALYRAAYAAE